MMWRYMPGGKSGQILFSSHPARVWPAAGLILISGGIGAGLCSIVHLLLPSASPLACGIGAVVAIFVAAFVLVHLFHRVEPMGLAWTVYLMCFLMLGGFLGGLSLLGVPIMPGGNPGPFLVLLMALAGASVPTLLVLLAIGDKGPPVDETRVGHPPRL
jgi:hypothetical protein